ncbi:plastocyanin/azurin family copper-binding protein [Hoeflea sp. TYP-13]|uniref:plastocyanin/azurin family copper-binding protein n=1 Tax=Hoeflea sp. TYP-13 TaxID=3230023 RepID=UPI0034C6C749
MTVLNRRQILSKTAAAFAAAVAGWSSRAQANSDDPETRKHVVEIRAFKFVPDTISVAPGDRITWINSDIVPHTATASDKSWDTGTIPKGGSKTVTATHGMSAGYFCRFHPMMKAALDIAGNS